VVLRWRNPATSVPVRMELWVDQQTRYQVRIDGVKPSSARPLLPPGRHVLMIEATPEAGAPVRMLFRATTESAPEALLISQPGSAWRWTGVEPPREAWEQPEADDSAWPTMTAGTTMDDETDKYAVRQLLEHGALVTTAPGAGPLWIRAVFDVPTQG
jgi:hypothetical protein